MDATCSTDESKEKFIKIKWSENLKGKALLEDLGLYDRNIRMGKYGLASSGSR
jgi:hypothetical protein